MPQLVPMQVLAITGSVLGYLQYLLKAFTVVEELLEQGTLIVRGRLR